MSVSKSTDARKGGMVPMDTIPVHTRTVRIRKMAALQPTTKWYAESQSSMGQLGFSQTLLGLPIPHGCKAPRGMEECP